MSDLAQLILNSDGSYTLHTNLSRSETVQRMRAALDHLEAGPYNHKAERVREAERTSSANDETTMAEEPIEHRLLRAWLNGFREGEERAKVGGRWDNW
jgi:hypothetical protein